MRNNHTTSFSASIQACTDVPTLAALSQTGNHRTRKMATAQINFLAQSVINAALCDAKQSVKARKVAPVKAKRVRKVATVRKTPAELAVIRKAAAVKAAATRTARKAASTVSDAS